MTKTNKILGVALIVQIIVSIVLFLPDNSASGKTAGPLLADFEPDQVVNVTIQNKDGDMIALHKTDEGAWVLPDRDDYPVQDTRVTQLLDKLKGINRNRLIARKPASHNQLGVGSNDYQRLITVELAEGDTHTIYLGTSGGAGAAHVRLGTEDNVYLTGEVAAWEVPTRLASWVDTTYFSVPRDSIVLLQIENPNGVFQLQKTDDAWTLLGLAEDETFDPESVTSLLNKVSQVRLDKPLGKDADPAWGMDEPLVKITLTVEETVAASEPEPESQANEDDTAVLESLDSLLTTTPTPDNTVAGPTEDITQEPVTETVEKVYELKFGQQLEDKTYPLIASESEFYVAVSASTAESFLNLTREDFLVTATEAETDAEAAPAEATATPSGGAGE